MDLIQYHVSSYNHHKHYLYDKFCSKLLYFLWLGMSCVAIYSMSYYVGGMLHCIVIGLLYIYRNITVLKFFMFVLITFAFCLFFFMVTLSQYCHNKKCVCCLYPILFRTFYSVYAEAIS